MAQRGPVHVYQDPGVLRIVGPWKLDCRTGSSGAGAGNLELGTLSKDQRCFFKVIYTSCLRQCLDRMLVGSIDGDAENHSQNWAS